MPDFYPPLLNPFLVRLCQEIAPPVCYWRHRITLKVDPASLQRLRDLQNHRILLLPNHPTYQDWIAIFLLSARLKRPFYYLAAYERFRDGQGKFLQNLGAYSIRRGLGDRPSVAKTLELLSQPGCRLVIFPEGGCSFQNDTVMPFRAGAVQIPLQTLNKLERQQGAAPDLYVLPVSLKYRYTSDMTPAIQDALMRLERTLYGSHTASVKSSKPLHLTPYERLRAVAEKVLVSLETEYDLHDQAIAQLPWNDRIPRIRNRAIADCEAQLDIAPNPNLPIRERVYRVQYELESRASQLGAENFGLYENLHRTAASLLNFDAIYDGYVAEAPTSERFLDTLIRLERQVFNLNVPPLKGHRDVLMHVGEAINLKDYLEDYKRDRARVVDDLTQMLRNRVQENLDDLIKHFT